MAIVPSHLKPTTKQDCVDTWRSRERIPVPTTSGNILDLMIQRLYETTHVDGLPLDLLIEGRSTKRAPLKRFGVVFADSKPLDDYPIPILWVCKGETTWLV